MLFSRTFQSSPPPSFSKCYRFLFIISFIIIIILMQNARLTSAKKSKKYIAVDPAKYLPLIKENATPESLAAIALAEYQESKAKPSSSYKKPKYYPHHLPAMAAASAPTYSMKQMAKYYSKKYQPPYPYKKVRHHHYHPLVLYKKKKIPGKYWHEAQRRLVTKHGGLDILGDIVQLPNGYVLDDNLGKNVPNLNDGYFKPWEFRAFMMRQQRQLVKSLMRTLARIAHNPPTPFSKHIPDIKMID